MKYKEIKPRASALLQMVSHASQQNANTIEDIEKSASLLKAYENILDVHFPTTVRSSITERYLERNVKDVTEYLRRNVKEVTEQASELENEAQGLFDSCEPISNTLVEGLEEAMPAELAQAVYQIAKQKNSNEGIKQGLRALMYLEQEFPKEGSIPKLIKQFAKESFAKKPKSKKHPYHLRAELARIVEQYA